ncbi:MAG: hypothetical protein R3E97_08415 [Candidatus Eisenbacteria bacterium]
MSGLGFLRLLGIILLGIFGGVHPSTAQTLLSDPESRATTEFPPVITDALDCLELQERLQRDRDAILARADSLGFAAEVAGPSERESFLREIEVVKKRYADVGLDLLLRQEVCRGLAAEAVREATDEIAAIQRDEGRDGREKAAALSRWLTARERLEGALTAATVYDYPVLPTQADETVETIELKLQYYEEVVGLLRALEDRIEVRLDSVRESAEALRDAWQFLEDLSFADMGDPNLGGHPLGGDPGSSAPLSRPEGGVSLGSSTSDIDFALSGSPVGPEQAVSWLRILEERRDAVQEVLSVMEDQLELHKARLASELP